jgi:thioredoxin-dependent peroxiredoxin
VILGASFDTPDENRAFAESNGFPFRLLSDVDRVAGRAYETLRAPEEQFPEWAKRRTFVIDPSGIIAKVYRVKDAGAHPGEVLEDLRAMIAG